MLRSREERFRKSVEELNKRLGRAENFLDTELGSPKMKQNSRSSLPAEVYRDRNTLVEVTVHRNSKTKESGAGKRDAKSWADSLSDTDVQFGKPTKSSLARARRSPIKQKKLEKPGGAEKETKAERSLSEILGELREILQVSGVKDIFEFVAEFDQKKKSGSSARAKSDQPELQKLQVEAEKNKVEAGRYREEYGVVVKQLEISRESVNNLEMQVTSLFYYYLSHLTSLVRINRNFYWSNFVLSAEVVDLKKIITRLTKNNGELLEIVQEKIKYEDIIADLEKKSALLNDELIKEKSASASLGKTLASVQTENASLR